MTDGVDVGRLRSLARRHLPLRLRAAVVNRLRDQVGWRQDSAAAPSSQGGFDWPASGDTIRDGVLAISGWALVDGLPPVRVDIRANGVLVGPARLGIPRPDLGGLGPTALLAGFQTVDAVPAAAGSGSLHIVAVAHGATPGRSVVVDGPAVSVQPERSGRSAPTRPTRQRNPDAPHLLVVTHQLDIGGGQLYLQDLLHGLVSSGRFRATVVSPVDGVLRDELEKIGIPVRLVTPWPVEDHPRMAARLAELTAWVRGEAVDAVVANTALAWPAVTLADAAGLPVVWTIHESYPLPVLWHMLLGADADPAVRAAATAALRTADRLVFEAAATMELYAPAAQAGRCTVIPYGVDLAALDRRLRGLDRAEVRTRFGVPADAAVLLCVGTVAPHKAQTVLLRAFAAVADRHPGSRLVLVGGGDTPYAEAVRQAAAATGLGPRIRVEPVTPDIVAWYLAADVLVSASDVESMPRSAIEAMALARPVLAARCYGVQELVEDGRTGWLVSPRDVDALAAGIDRVLGLSPSQRQAAGRRAADAIRARHDSGPWITAVGDLLDGLLAARPTP